MKYKENNKLLKNTIKSLKNIKILKNTKNSVKIMEIAGKLMF